VNDTKASFYAAGLIGLFALASSPNLQPLRIVESRGVVSKCLRSAQTRVTIRIVALRFGPRIRDAGH